MSSSLQGLQQRELNKRFVVEQSTVDTDIALRLKYVGTGTVTSVTVTTATDITFVTSDGGTDQYTWAAFTTLGALCDAINRDGIFQAKILDGLRSEATAASRFKTGALTAAHDGNCLVWDMLFDTNTIAPRRMCSRITYDRTFGSSQSLIDGHRVSINELVSSFTLGATDALGIKIYECKPRSRGGTETLVFQRTPTSGAVTTINWSDGKSAITAKEGNDLVVFVTDATSFGANDYLTVSGILE